MGGYLTRGSLPRKHTREPAQRKFLRLRYKQPDGDISQLIEWPLTRARMLPDWHAASERFRFAAAVAGFGQLLRDARDTGDFGYDQVLALARDARANKP